MDINNTGWNAYIRLGCNCHDRTKHDTTSRLISANTLERETNSFTCRSRISFLSAFTVYEFNESASYYLTADARNGNILNEKDYGRIQDLESNKEILIQASNNSSERLVAEQTNRDSALVAIENDFKLKKTKNEELWNIKRKPHEKVLNDIKIAQKGDLNIFIQIEEIKQEIEQENRNHKDYCESEKATQDDHIVRLKEQVEDTRLEIANTKTGPFTGGTEKIRRLEKQIQLHQGEILMHKK